MVVLLLRRAARRGRSCPWDGASATFSTPGTITALNRCSSRPVSRVADTATSWEHVMKTAVAFGNWWRTALGLVTPAALIVAGGGSALAASGPAAAAGGVSAVTCTVHWAGRAVLPDWTTAKNWSTGQVPGPADDVCIGTGADVLTNVSIQIHSLRLGPDAGIALEGTSSKPLSATVATFVDMTGTYSRIDLADASVSAARISDPGGGTIWTDGNCSLISPHIAFGSGGGVNAASGTTTLSSLPQLSNGTLTGASLNTSDAVLVLPGDITHLVASNVGVGATSAIQDTGGHNALTGLTSIDAQSSLTADSALSLTGPLDASGNVTVGGGATLAVGGTFTQAQGTLSLYAGGPATVRASQVVIGQPAFLLAEQGTIAGSLANDGSASVFGLTVTGSYTQSSAGTLGAALGEPLAVTGQATLAGAADSGQPDPSPGASGPVITFGSLSGNFTSHGLGINLLTKQRKIDAIITPQIASSATAVIRGQQVTVSGASFRLGENVSIYLDQAAGAPLATAIGRYFGRFTTPVTIPWTSPGQHKLIAVGSEGSRTHITVTVS